MTGADPIVVVPYDPAWPAAFQAERDRIAAAIPLDGTIIEHIGSTSVPGLAAKPVVDILIGIGSLEWSKRWVPALQSLDYEYMPIYEESLPNRRFFRRFEGQRRTHHIHMVQVGTHDWERHRAVRDYLRSHPAEAAAYGALKLQLAQLTGGDREAFADAKDAFVVHLERRALSWTYRW